MTPFAAIRARLRHATTGGVLTFARNVVYMVGSDLAVSAVTFLLTASFIRHIGPQQFGIVNLVTSIAQMCMPFMLLGMPAAATFYLAKGREQPTVVGSALMLAAGCSALVGVAVWACASLAAGLLRVDLWTVRAGVLFAVPLGLYYLGQALLSGTRQFRLSGLLNLGVGALFAVVTAAMLVTGVGVNATGFLASSSLRWLGFGAAGLVACRRIFGAPTAGMARTLAAYGSTFAATSSIYVFVLASIDNVMLNAWHGAETVGIYGAYYAGFNLVVSRLMRQVSEVWMPTAAGRSDVGVLFRKASRSLALVSLPAVVGVALLTAVVFQVYGRAYPFAWHLALMTGVAAMLHVTITVFGDLLNASGLAGVRTSLWAAVATALVKVLLNYALIPSLAIAGTLVASIGASTISIVIRMVALRGLSRRS